LKLSFEMKSDNKELKKGIDRCKDIRLKGNQQ